MLTCALFSVEVGVDSAGREGGVAVHADVQEAQLSSRDQRVKKEWNGCFHTLPSTAHRSCKV